MEFIDNLGNIFSQKSYDKYPVGYEYETNKYVFWLDDETGARLSIDCYYMKPVRFLTDTSVNYVEVSVDSNVFSLVDSNKINEKICNSDDCEIDIDLDSEEDTGIIKKTLVYNSDNQELVYITNNEYKVWTFYVIGKTNDAATWTSQILIYTNNGTSEEWCPITIGGNFYDEQEELVINGANLGVSFPKDIIHAIWGTSVYNGPVNKAILNDKIKEYLMNYMLFHGEKGNIEQAYAGLEWFGWGKKNVSIVQLIRTDNRVITQYIRDVLDISNDADLYAFSKFKPTSLVSLITHLNQETGETASFDFNGSFWGEGKPELEDLTEKMVPVNTNNESLPVYYKAFYDYCKTELLLKLACLRYFYDKFMLPIHMMTLSAAGQWQVFANDIKFFGRPFNQITEVPVITEDKNYPKVTFPDDDTLYIYTQEHLIDSNFNIFSDYSVDTEYPDLYYLNDVCCEVPISIVSDSEYFQCHLILERNDGQLLWESDFNFTQSETSKYVKFIICPHLMKNMISLDQWENKQYCIHLLVNGVWFDYIFQIKVPEMHIETGYLEYKYDHDSMKQVKSISDDYIDFNSYMWQKELVDVSHMNFPEDVIKAGQFDEMEKFVDLYKDSPNIPDFITSGMLSRRYYNRVHYYKILKNVSKDSTPQWKEILYNPSGDETLDSGVVTIDPSEPSMTTRDIMSKFFNNDGEYYKEQPISCGKLTYDIYVMHDSWDKSNYVNLLSPSELEDFKAHWYLIAISKETLTDCDKEADMMPPDIQMLDNKHTVKYVKSDSKWLINRMSLVKKDIAHYKTDDIIGAHITNIEMPYILTAGTHWDMTPFSLKTSTRSTTHSHGNMALLALGNEQSGHEPGYYNLIVHYTLDGDLQNIREHRARILIEK